MTTAQPQNPSMIDGVNNTSIRQQYERFANAMRITETLAGSYLQVVRPAVGGTPPLRENEFGEVILKANENGMISLDNSSIYFEQTLAVAIPSQDEDPYIKEYYIGYKDVAGIITQYLILSNADPVQNKTNCDYEWYLKSISKLTAAVKNNPSDAILAKIRARNPHVPGVYISLAGIPSGGAIYNIVLNLKMAVTKFLILNDLRWLADWMGTWTIRMWLSMRNIVVAPVIPEALFTKYPNIEVLMNTINNNNDGTSLVHFGFHHLNEPMRNRFKINEATGAVEILLPQVWRCENHETVIRGIDTRHFMVRSDLAHELRAEYKNFPLLLPMMTVEYNNFTSKLGNAESIQPTCSAQLLYADAAYIVYKSDSLISKQCFVNPFARYQLNIGSNHYPPVKIRTVNDLKEVDQTNDALNLNNSLLGCVSDDVATSMQPFTKVRTHESNTFKWTTGDMSTFVSAIPFTDSGIFQGGLSHKGDVMLMIERLHHPEVPRKCSVVHLAEPVLVTTQERLLAIYSERPEHAPQVQILTNKFDEFIK